MALLIYWYDFICFAIIAAAVFCSLWVLWQKECAGRCDKSMYESLLISQSNEDDEYVSVTQPGHVGSFQLWTSCWRGVHPIWLLGLRLVSVVVMSGFLAWDVKQYDTSIFVYYTEWTFSLTIFYFLLGTIISAYGCLECWKTPFTTNEERNGFLKRDLGESYSTTTINFRTNKSTSDIKLQSHHEQEEIEQRAGFWGYMMQTVYQACAGAVILTDIVFWCVIVPFLSIQHFSLNLLMGCMHTVNAVFLLLDTALNNLPFPWFRLAYFVLWSCVYIIFQWIIHACGFSWWPYPFLELSTPWAPLWYFCLALMHIPCYAMYALIIKWKNSFFSRWFPHAYVRTY